MKNKNLYLLLISVTIFLILIYHSTFVWLYERYISADSYYSHGFLVPFVSVFLIWLKRRDLKIEKGKFNPLGLILIVFSLLVHYLSLLAGVYFISGFSILGLVFGISLFLFGNTLTKKIAFPLFFLIFMFPLPLVAVNTIGFPLKMFVTDSVVFFLKNAVNLPVRNEGFRIFFPTGSLLVENPCSGLRSLIVMLALGSIFAYFLRSSIKKKVILFLLCIPVALLSNMLRVVLLSLSVYVYGGTATQKYFHDLTGYLMFSFAFLCLWFLWRLFQCRDSA